MQWGNIMKRQWKQVCIILIICILTATGCAGIGADDQRVSSYRYEDAEQYTVGGGVLEHREAESIKRLDIGWINGEVEIIYHPEDTIIFSEDGLTENDDHLAMHHWVDGDTLRIRFAESGEWKFRNVEKSLTIHLPEDHWLDEIEVDTASADVVAHGLKAKKADVDTVSGNIDVVDAEIDDSFSADTTSGAISLMFAESLKELELDTVSGEICVTATELYEFDIDSTGGGVKVSTATAPISGGINTVSGSVELILPETAEFTAEINTVSGQMESDFALAKRGKEYRCGSGVCRYEVDTTSGNISFRLQ